MDFDIRFQQQNLHSFCDVNIPVESKNSGDFPFSLKGHIVMKLEKEMATYSNILAWKIPWTEELVWLQSMELQRIRHI